jgi:hypothetical protein
MQTPLRLYPLDWPPMDKERTIFSFGAIEASANRCPQLVTRRDSEQPCAVALNLVLANG